MVLKNNKVGLCNTQKKKKKAGLDVSTTTAESERIEDLRIQRTWYSYMQCTNLTNRWSSVQPHSPISVSKVSMV